MFSIVGTTITLTRGDTFEAQISLTRNGVAYVPEQGDSIRFYVKHNSLNSAGTEYLDVDPVIEKIVDMSTLILRLEPDDTKSLGFGYYVYDLEMTFANGDIDTFINNAKLILSPEVGSVSEDEEPEEEVENGTA